MELVSGFAKGAPERGAGSPNGLSEGFSYSVDEQTPPVSLTLNHLPFQGRQGRFAPRDAPLFPIHCPLSFATMHTLASTILNTSPKLSFATAWAAARGS